MGNYGSSDRNCLDDLYNAYKAHGTLSATVGGEEGVEGVEGNCGSCFGASGSYEFSFVSAAKRKMIKDIAKVLHDQFKIGKDPKNMNIDEIVASLKNSVPGASGFKFKASDDVHRKACAKIAEGVNKVMGTVVVNTSGTPEEICSAVSEMVGSLTTNIAAEFGPMRADLERVSKNLGVLEGMVKNNFAAIKSKLGTMVGEGAELDPAIRPLFDFHDKLLQETDRQRTILRALTDTLASKTEADLNEVLKKNPEFKKLVSDIKAGPPSGTEGFSKKLAYLMTGFAGVAEAAKIVDEALRQIGVSRGEYKSAMKPKDVKNLVNKKIVASLGKATEAELENYLKAAKKIVSQGYLNKDIAASFSSKQGGADGSTSGGLKLDKRVKKREETRRGLLQVFNQQLGALYNSMSSNIQAIAKEVGSRHLELTDDLRLFVDALEVLPDIGKKNIYYSLTGYFDDTSAKEERSRFLNGSKNMIKTIDELVKNPDFGKVHQLRDLQKSLAAINELIETFYKRFSEGFGPVEAYVKGAEGPEGGDIKDDIVFGSQNFSMKEINRVSYEFARARDVMKYNFRVNKIRENFKKLPAERASFTQDYSKIVGDAVAKAVDDETNKKNAFDARIKDGGDIYNAYKALAPNDVAKQMREVRSLYDNCYKARVDMYRTAEAIEHYMEAFTNGIAANPDDIGDILHMLNSVEIIPTWYGKHAGNEFCHVFDCFPGNAGAGASADVPNRVRTVGLHAFENAAGAPNNEHYYQAINRMCTAAPLPGAVGVDRLAGDAINIPGNPFLSMPIWKSGPNNDQMSARIVLDHIDNALQVNPLKNIVSIFINMGSKFGSQELLSKTHMTAVQIYKALLNYVKFSSLSVGIQTGDNALNSVPGRNPPLRAMRSAHDLLRNANIVSGSYMNNAAGTVTAMEMGYTGVSTGAAVFDPTGATRPEQEHAVAVTGTFNMAGVGTASRDNPYQRYLFDPFLETDKLFQLTIKSIVSKVFTTIGVYNMLHKPIRKDALGFYNAARVVIGGVDHIPQVIPEAMELYVRLPLLAEFYRELFDFTKTPGNNVTDPNPDINLITMVPEMSGTFSGFISVIFDRAKYVTEGNYSETDTISIVEEINKIWLKFKSSKNPVNDIIDELIMEVNRRYGVLSAEERERYNYERNNRFRDRFATQGRPGDIEDFPILPDEDDDAPPLPAPSQAFQEVFPGGSKGLGTHKHQLNLDGNATLLRKLRIELDKQFAKADLLAGPRPATIDGLSPSDAMEKVYQSPISFAEILRVRKNELKHASGDKERFQVVMNAINGFGSFATSALDKSYIMFHEMVIYPLTVLQSVYIELNNFRTQADILSLGPRPPRTADDLRDIFELISSHCGDFGKLVELQVDVAQTKDELCDIRVNVSHAGLIERVKSQISQIKDNIEKFRGLLPKSLLDRYSDYAPGRGSVGTMEKLLVDELIHGRPAAPGAPAADLELWPIDRYNERLNDAIKDCLNAAIPRNPAMYNSILKRLVSYDNAALPVLGLAIGALTQNTALGLFKLLFNNSGKSKSGVQANDPWVASTVNTLPYYEAANPVPNFSNNQSVWASFNRLVALYLHSVYDSGLGRIYGTTIDKFASGAFSGSVFGTQTYNDAAVYPAGPNDYDVSGGILFKSLAVMIKQLVSEPSLSGDKKQYFEPDLAEIPTYMRERMKCYLPIFKKLFTLLAQRCALIRKFVQGFAHTADVRTRLSNVLDQVESGCTSLIGCISETLTELNDSPKYMELSENFIEQYKNANKKYPFMPPSSLSKYLKNKNLGIFDAAGLATVQDLLPIDAPGSTSFKLLYGSRNIINSNPKLGDMPGMLEIMKMHNSGVSGKSQFNEKDVENTIINGIDLLNMNLNISMYKRLLSLQTSNIFPFYGPPIIMPGETTIQLILNNTRIVTLTESPDQKLQLQFVSRHVQTMESCDEFKSATRDSIRVYNIIDLNKMPINVAALMKEMPLVNLHNYSYSFDTYMMEICGLTHAELNVELTALSNSPFSITLDKLRGNTGAVRPPPAINPIMNGKPENAIINNPAPDNYRETARLLGLLLMFPHDEVATEVYDLYVPRIMRGDTAIEGLDRPAFLGEELYNKALFGELYPNITWYDESGPRSVSLRGQPRPGVAAAAVAPAMGATSAIYPQGYQHEMPGRGSSLLGWMVKGDVHSRVMGPNANNKDLLQSIGKLRFDTKLVRNYLWIANLQRVMRLQMRRDLFWYDSKIVNDHAVLAPNITELTGNQLDAEVRGRAFMN